MCKNTCMLSVLAVCGLIAPILAQQVEPGLVGWWKLDETTGLVATDSSGFGNDGKLQNTSVGHWTTGMRDGALEFFGNREYIDCGTGTSLDVTNDFTIAAWVQLAPGTDGRYGGIAGRLTRKNGDADYWGFALVRYNSNVFRLWVADGNTGAINASASSDATYTDAAWHHVVGVRKGKLNVLYMDGVLQKATSNSEFIPSKEFFHIGKQYNYLDDRYFAGLIDDVRLYNRALSSAEVVTLAMRSQAHDPSPADGEKNILMPLLQWQPGTGALWHDVYFGSTPDLGPAQFVGRQFMPMYFHPMPLLPGSVYYWRVDEIEADGTTTHLGEVWSFSTVYETAYAPKPFDGAKWVDPNAALTWSPSMAAASHDVYFSTSKDDVATGAASAFKGNTIEATFTPGKLAAQTSYYWRIDELDAQGDKKGGSVWSFTTLGPGGGVKGEYFSNMGVSGAPGLVRIDPGIDFNWGDPGGPGTPIGVDGFSCRWTANLEVPFTEKYTFMTNSDDGVRLWVNGVQLIDNWTDHSATENRGNINLEAGQVYSLVMEMYENGGGATAQLYWMSPSIPKEIIPVGPLQPPLRARDPNPFHGAVAITQAPVLRWMSGDRAVAHDIYFGADATAVAEATPATTGIYQSQQALDNTSFTPGALEWNKTYYWRVDEVNEADAQSPWKGSVWSFTTADFIVVDDFEGYTSDVGNRIFQAWIDGFGYTEPEPGNPGNGTCSTVGTSTVPWVELGIVHHGRQAMPFDYNNTASPYYSETDRTWSTPQNWKTNGANTLSLFFQGTAGNGPDTLYVAVQDSAGKAAVMVHPDVNAVTKATWQEWSIPLTDLTGVNVAAIKKMYLGVGNRQIPKSGGAGKLFFDDIRVIAR